MLVLVVGLVGEAGTSLLGGASGDGLRVWLGRTVIRVMIWLRQDGVQGGGRREEEEENKWCW